MAVEAVRIAVVVPTRDRPELAVKAVESLLAQQSDHPFRVLVSDNSSGDAAAATLRDYCESVPSAAGQRPVYLRPPADLPMPAHWEWARVQATTDGWATHLAYVTDRTVLRPGALDLLGRLAAAHPDLAIAFNNDLVDDYDEPVTLRLEPWSDAVLRVPTARLTELTSELILPRALPRMLNTVVPVAVLDRIAERHGAAFSSVAPDYFFCFRLFQSERELVYVDRSLSVMHGLRRSNGNSTSRGVASPDTVDFLRKAEEGGGLAAATPLPEVATTYNVIAQEYLAASTTGDPDWPALNQRAYVGWLARETDGFVAGPMKAANVAALQQHGVRFTRAAGLRRSAAHVVHLLRFLGPVDFVALTVDRLRGGSQQVASSSDAALELAAGTLGRKRGTGRRLHYLHGTTLH